MPDFDLDACRRVIDTFEDDGSGNYHPIITTCCRMLAEIERLTAERTTYHYWAIWSGVRRKWYNADHAIGEWWERFPQFAVRYGEEADARHDATLLGADCQAVCITVTHPALESECPEVG
jgi:hypothetical protein